MIRKTFYISAVLILLLLATKFFTNEKSWVIKFYVDNGKNQSRTLIYIKGDKMKIVTKDRTYIYNTSSKKISFLNQKKESYWQGKIKAFTKATTKFKLGSENDFLINDISFLRNLNSIDRKNFTEMINRRTGTNPLIPDYTIFNNFNIKSTPNFTSVGDFVVRKYEITNSGKVMEEIWIAENLLTHMDWKINDFKEFLEAFFFHSGIAPYFNLDAYVKVRKNGLPMKVIIFRDEDKTTITMDHASKTKLNDSSFSIPKGYLLKPIGEVLKTNYQDSLAGRN